MDLNTYSKLAMRTANNLGTELNNVMHATMGMAGEAGECLDLVKKSFAYGKPMSKEALLLETGDLIWYINLLLHTLGTSWEETMERNIVKLETRYPNLRFEADHAINRDHEKEAQAIKG